jgi:hypothetical protein
VCVCVCVCVCVRARARVYLQRSLLTRFLFRHLRWVTEGGPGTEGERGPGKEAKGVVQILKSQVPSIFTIRSHNGALTFENLHRSPGTSNFKGRHPKP